MTRKVKTKDRKLQRLIKSAQRVTRNEKFKRCFDSKGQFNKTFVMQQLTVVSSGLKGKAIDFTMILLDAGDKKRLKRLMKKYGELIKNFPPGQGQALFHDNKPYIVIYCDKENGSQQQVKETAIHEIIHLLDSELDEEYDTEYYYGHSVEQDRGEENNYGIPYPGMYGSNSYDVRDKKYAQYYTCKSERKEMTYDVIAFVDDYARRTNTPPEQMIQKLLNCLDNKGKFKRLLQKLEETGFSISALPMLYHLAFSKQKNGDKQDAKKILENLI